MNFACTACKKDLVCNYLAKARGMSVSHNYILALKVRQGCSHSYARWLTRELLNLHHTSSCAGEKFSAGSILPFGCPMGNGSASLLAIIFRPMLTHE